MDALPEALLSAIREGNCVAFVGAGFSGAAGLPGWPELLRRIADRSSLPTETRQHVRSRVEKGTAHALDEAAQALADALGKRIVDELRRELWVENLPAPMRNRLRWLWGIPFRTVLTTNFDGIVRGKVADLSSYAEALRARPRSRWDAAFWPDSGLGGGALKLHGDLSDSGTSVVLTRRDYRRRLYHEAGYGTFIRSLLSTTTFLYLGFSFEDACFNELRSETLALLGQRTDGAPVAYAIVNDVGTETATHFRRHEGIQILPFSTGTGGGDFRGFDEYLEAIYAATNPVVSFGRHLERRRILWVDPNPRDAKELAEFFGLAARSAGRAATAVEHVGSADEAMRAMEGAAEPFDLVITHWGDGLAFDSGGRQTSTAERVLRFVRERNVESPVIVFAMIDADVRKERALRLGALDYCIRYEALLDRVDSAFAPGVVTA